MYTLPRPRLLLLLAALASATLVLQPANVDAQTQRVRPPQGPSAYTTEKDKMNAWTVGLAGGLLEGAPSRSVAALPVDAISSANSVESRPDATEPAFQVGQS